MCISFRSSLPTVLPFTFSPAERMRLFSYTPGSISLCLVSVIFFWGEFLRNFLNQGTQLVMPALQSLVDPGTPCFFPGQSGTLKTALLDYIKRCRPGDSEKHNMIALCFSMCREIGENHEAAACIQLKLIESQPWGEHVS